MKTKIRAIGTLALSVVGAILYRMGGAAGFNTKFRDFGIPACMVGVMISFGQFKHWTDLFLILCFGAVFAVQTTYWKKKGTEAKWYNWLFTGLGYSLAMAPIVVAQNWPGMAVPGLHTHYLGFGIRTVACTALTVIWSVKVGNAVWEENGRGFIQIVTLPLLFIG